MAELEGLVRTAPLHIKLFLNCLHSDSETAPDDGIVSKLPGGGYEVGPPFGYPDFRVGHHTGGNTVFSCGRSLEFTVKFG